MARSANKQPCSKMATTLKPPAPVQRVPVPLPERSKRGAVPHEARRIAANIAKPPEREPVRLQKLPAAFSGPAQGLRRRTAIR
jgi:hypothetical protein